MSGGIIQVVQAAPAPGGAVQYVPAQDGQQTFNISEEEWMKTYFQPEQYTNQQVVAVEPGLYASGASDVSEALSTVSMVEDIYDTSLIPQGYVAPQVMTVPVTTTQQFVALDPNGNNMTYRSLTIPKNEIVQQPTQQIVQQVQQPVQQVPQQQPQQQQQQVIATIGASVWQTGGYFVIASITPGSSAEAAGLVSGDIVRKLDRVSVRRWSYERVVATLRGAPGSRVIVRTNTKKVAVVRDCAADVQEQAPQQPQPQQVQQVQVQQQVQQVQQQVQPVQQQVQQVQQIQQVPIQQTNGATIDLGYGKPYYETYGEQPVQYVTQGGLQYVEEVVEQPQPMVQQIQYVERPMQRQPMQYVEYVQSAPRQVEYMAAPRQQVVQRSVVGGPIQTIGGPIGGMGLPMQRSMAQPYYSQSQPGFAMAPSGFGQPIQRMQMGSQFLPLGGMGGGMGMPMARPVGGAERQMDL